MNAQYDNHFFHPPTDRWVGRKNLSSLVWAVTQSRFYDFIIDFFSVGGALWLVGPHWSPGLVVRKSHLFLIVFSSFLALLQIWHAMFDPRKKYYSLVLGSNHLMTGWLTVWPDLAIFRHFGNILEVFGHFEGLHSIRQNQEPTLTYILCFIASFQWCKWTNIEQKYLVIWSHWWITQFN